MKKLYLLIVFIISLIGCNDEPTFPDPGFDLISDKEINIRRDTADTYTLQLNIDAPGGIDYIQILNGRTYEVLDEITEHRNKKSLRFSYTFDFNSIDNTQDTILIYNLRVVTNDLKAYNSSYVIHLKKLSKPEITFPFGDVLGTNMEMINLQCDITTGIYTISSIEVLIDDTEQYSISDNDLGQITEFNLETLIPYPFINDTDYDLKVIVTDSKGQVTVENKTIRKIKIKRPKVIEKNMNGLISTFDLFYDDDDRLIKIILEPYDSPEYYANTFEIFYNEEGLVDHIIYYNHYNEEIVIVSITEFTYVDKKVSQVFHGIQYVENPEMKFSTEIFENIAYREDGTIRQFNFGASTVEEVQYSTGFLPGEMIFCESWKGMISWGSLYQREIKKGFVPILNPVFIDNMPQIWCPNLYDFSQDFVDLFWYKYIFTENAAGYDRVPNEYDAYDTFSYECDEDGQLTSLTRKLYGSDVIWMHHFYTFIY